MPGKRRKRLLPDRSKLALVAGLVLILLAGVAFLDLAATKSEALADQQRIRHKIALAMEQKEMLQRALEQGQQEQNIVPDAFRYYGRTPEDMTVVVPQTPSVEPVSHLQVQAAEPGSGLVEQLNRFLTNLLKWVQ